jgi:hypothetical protein
MSFGESPTPESAGADIRQQASADAMFTVSAVTPGSAISWVSATGKLAGDATWLATGCHFVRLDLSQLSMLDRAGRRACPATPDNLRRAQEHGT